MSRASAREFRRWLPLSIVNAFAEIAKARGVSEVARRRGQFLDQYRRSRGQPKRLSQFWRDKRNAFVARHGKQAKSEQLWEDVGPIDMGRPTRRLIALVVWAWAPPGVSNTKLKAFVKAWRKQRSSNMKEAVQDRAGGTLTFSMGDVDLLMGDDELSSGQAEAVSMWAMVNGIEEAVLSVVEEQGRLLVEDVTHIDGEDLSELDQEERRERLMRLRWPPLDSPYKRHFDLGDGAAAATRSAESAASTFANPGALHEEVDGADEDDSDLLEQLRQDFVEMLLKMSKLSESHERSDDLADFVEDTPFEDAELIGGHAHYLDRVDREAKQDRGHWHFFVVEEDVVVDGDVLIPAGTQLFTQRAGGHVHKFGHDGSFETRKDGAHRHRVIVPNGRFLDTEEGGEHVHQLLVETTSFDGIHDHALVLPDGSRIRSGSAHDLWTDRRRLETPDVSQRQTEAVTDPFMKLPEDNEPKRYVVHREQLGGDFHHVLRLWSPEGAIAWVLLTKKATSRELVANSVDEVVQAEDKNPGMIDFDSGDFDRVDDQSRRINILAIRKDVHDRSFLDLENTVVDEEGEQPRVLVRVDHGQFFYGWQQSNAHEYFFDGEGLKGKILFRAIDEAETQGDLREALPAPEGELITDPGFDWLAIQVKNQTPGILTRNSIEDREIGVLGFSYMPSVIADAIPESLRFWNVPPDEGYQQVRERLVSIMERTEIGKMIADTVFTELDGDRLSEMFQEAIAKQEG